MKKNLLLLFLIVPFLHSTSAQDYQTGIGVKIGMAPGISAKHFLTTNGAVEGIATFRWGGVNFAALGEFHLPIFDTEGMSFYYGGGFHVGVWDTGLAKNTVKSGQQLNLGIDGIVGLEYAFFDVPLSLGLDWKPNFNIIRNSRMIIDEISFSIRYLIR
ncbi:hypothetical protein ACFLSP_00170 [Bacteroidota bacterium]